MKKILAAVDDTEASRHALHDAEQLARELHAELTLVYVSPPYSMPMELSAAPGTYLGEDGRTRGDRLLSKALADVHDVDVKTANLRGPPAETIADLAMAENFDLVVVGNEHKSALSRILLGSISDRLVHICPRPVLVVR